MYVTIFYMKKLTILSLLIIFTSISAAFATGGGADVGGADLRTSTIEEIRAAYKDVLIKFRAYEHDRIETKDDIYKIIQDLLERHDDDKDEYYFFINGTRKTNEEINKASEESLSLQKKLEALPVPQSNEPYPEYDKLMLEISKLNKKRRKLKIAYFNDDRFIIEEDKSCLDLAGNKKLGSVTELTPNGRICISFHELKKTAPHELRSRIAGLIAHEHSHLNGYNEPQAHRIQDTVLRFVDIIFPKQKEVYTQFERGIRDSLYLIDRNLKSLIKNINKKTSKEARKYYSETIAKTMGQIQVLLMLLPQDLNTGGVPLSFNSKVHQIKSKVGNIYIWLSYLKHLIAYGEPLVHDQGEEEDVEASWNISTILKKIEALKLKELIDSTLPR